MTELYSTSEFLNIKKKLRNLLISYFVALVVCILAVTIIMIIYANEPFGTPLRIPFLIVLILICVLFVAYSFVFFNIKFSKLRKYQYFIYFAINGKNKEEKATIISISNAIVEINGFDCYSLEALVWSDIESDYVTRLVYFDAEKDMSEIEVDKVYDLSINSNYIVAYRKVSL